MSNKDNGRMGITLTVILIVGVAVIESFAAFEVTNQSIKKDTPERAIGDFVLVSDTALVQDSKIVVLFIGAEACPFCVA